MADTLTTYRVFISCPAGLTEERNALRRAILEFNESRGLSNGVMFLPMGGETTPGGLPRPPAMVHDEIRGCDYFILALHDRWRARTDTGQDCEEEFELALECMEIARAPMRQVAVFFKRLDPRAGHFALHAEQIEALRDRLLAQRRHAVHDFESLSSLMSQTRAILAEWESSHRRSPKLDAAPSPGDLKAHETHAGDLLHEAARLADKGRLSAAEACYALAIGRADEPRAFLEYGRFLRRIGRTQSAWEQFEKAGTIARQRRDKMLLSNSLAELARICKDRGDLAKAAQLQRRALALAKGKDNAARAASYADLALVHKARGDLSRAEDMIRRALALEKKLGREAGVANACCNLGLLSRRRGDLDKAEQLLRHALEIDERLGRTEAMANQYANIALVLKARGELDAAEAMLRKALAINEGLSRLEGLASDYGNLGLIHQARGDLDEAERLHLTSLALEEQIGRAEGVARSKRSLGQIALSRGDPSAALKLWREARAQFSAIGMRRDAKDTDELIKSLANP